ncbi:hypothetical protein S7711_07815 [Stachybotrys chartarum IBT 7711]|uniref:Prenylated Rab acceptor 1 n=1 Tax=Stachybotrys chartarum (strain CBS 109288 / IBT 7711) TaxID=1280523 RepID=A0A084AQN9_STACB|nr:hypothetical protein S7711_07815 [Stachybotrys chartarum IBT 7711]
MSRIQIPLDVLTSRLNLGDRLQSLRSGGVSGRLANLRPLTEFFDVKRVSKPANFTEVQSRVNYNLSHFSSNYAVIFAMLSIYALLSNWLLLFDIIFVVAGMFLIGRLDGRDFELGNFRASSSQLYTGIVVIAVPLGLLASPFSTLLWLIGASGVTILGHASFMDKPIDEGAGLSMRRSTRFASDSLHFTGTDLGDRTRGTSRRRYYEDDDEDDEEETSSTDEDEAYEEELARLSPREREEIIVQNALQRIQRAQERGSTDVRLSKEEFTALERRKKRLEEEAERRQREAASGSERRKRRERVAIPISQFEPVTRRQTPSNHLLEDEDHQVYPPMGYFPPPAGTRTRQRSGTSASQRPPSRVGAVDERGSSPLNYDYMSRPSSSHRHVSDSIPRPRSSRSIHQESPASSRSGLDPFQFQTAGPRAPQIVGAAAASRRHASGPAEMTQALRRGAAPPAAARSSRGSRRATPDEDTSEEESETSEETSGDELGHGAQIIDPPTRVPPPRGRASTIVVEESPERRPTPPSKKKSSGSSPVKRKPAASSGGRRRKK